jgi:hypothetical protein
MGIIFSKYIDVVLSQIAPLTRKIQLIILLGIVLQILIVILLCHVLLAITALIISVIPELSNEREVFVTPTVKWLRQSWNNSQNLQRNEERRQLLHEKSRYVQAGVKKQ